MLEDILSGDNIAKIFCVVVILVGVILALIGGVSLVSDAPNGMMFVVGMFLVVVFLRILSKI